MVMIESEELACITIKEGQVEGAHGWRAEIQFCDGRKAQSNATSLLNLIQSLPSYNRPAPANSEPRLIVTQSIEFFGFEELLGLLQVNRGAQSLDISHCHLGPMDIGRDKIGAERKTFLLNIGFDPDWWDGGRTRGIDLRYIIAKHAVFEGCNLEGANFANACLQEAMFERAKLAGADFSKADLARAWMQDADVRGVDFYRANLQRAVLVRTKLIGANVHDANMEGTDFFGVEFKGINGLYGKTNFSGASFMSANLAGVNLEGLAPMALDGALLDRASLDRTSMRREHIGEMVGEERIAKQQLSLAGLSPSHPMAGVKPSEMLHRASDTYRNLKSNFAGLGRTEDTSWAHYKQRHTYGQHFRVRWSEEKTARLAFRVLSDWVFRLSSGYGERPMRPMGTALCLILLYASVYFAIGRFTHDEFSVIESIIYSGASFLTMSFSGIEADCWLTQLISLSEAGLGIVLLGLFIWTIGNASGRF